MEFENGAIIEGGEEFFYPYAGKAYRCIYFDGDVWLSLFSVSKIMGIDAVSVSSAFASLAEKGIVSVDKNFKYYFYDGNRQSYLHWDNNYYNLDACVALSVALGSYGLLGYVEYARENLVKISKSGIEKIHGFKTDFVDVRPVHHESGEVVVSHEHDCYELVYYVSGGGRTTCKYGNFNFCRDSIALIAPHVKHEEYITEESECVCLAFTLDAALATAFYTPTEETLPTVRAVGDVVRELLALADDGVNSVERRNRIITVVFLLNKLAQTSKPESVYYDAAVDYVKTYIDSNYAYKINFDILSERVGYSPNYLNNLFKNKYGISVHAYLTDVRLLKARELLLGSSIRLGVIAKRCGFSSESRFCQFFKEKMGVSPLVYRRIGTTVIEGGVLPAGKKP